MGGIVSAKGWGPFKSGLASARRGGGAAPSGGFDAYVVSLLHMDGLDNGAVFTDETGKSWTRLNANAKTGTTIKKFGTAALNLSTASNINTATSADFTFGSADFTVDYWAYPTANDYSAICGLGDPNSSDGAIFGTPAGFTCWWKDGGTTKAKFEGGATIPINEWSHVAFVRSGASMLFFLNGNSVNVTEKTAISNNSLDNTGKPLVIGAYTDTNASYKGYVDEFRISKGIARWVAPFVPPSAPYA